MRSLVIAFALAMTVVSTAWAVSEPAVAGQESSATAADGCSGLAKRDRRGGRERSVLVRRERCGGVKIFDGSGLFNRRGCGG